MNDMQLEQIVRTCGKDILRFCRITTGNEEEGDELYQDTMLTLLEKQIELDSEGNIKSYAISIALKLWRNRRRKFARRLRLVPQESLEELTELGLPVGDAQMSPEELVIQRSLLGQVRSLVHNLPEQYRLPIELFYAANLPIRSIAQVLKLPENTVKSRLHRGKEIIRQKLEEAEYD